MPVLIFSDGKRGTVPYSKASEINEVLIGNKKPKDQEQADFIANVASIVWDRVGDRNNPIKKDSEALENRRRLIKAVQNDPSLSGREKASEIAKIIKTH